MKKTISMILCVMLILSLVGCGKTQNTNNEVPRAKKTTENGTPVSGVADMPINSDTVDTEQTQIAINETSVDMNKVKEKYPEFFEIEGEPFKGIEIYVWQMAEDLYYCGLMFGTNRNKSDDEIFALQEKALTVDETKTLLNDIGVSKDSIFVYPIAQPYSSYLYEIDDDYCNKVSELFDEKFVVMNSES